MGSFSGKKKTTSTSTSTVAPTSAYAPYTNQAVGDAQKIYQDNTPLFQSLAGKAMGVSNGLGVAAGTAASLAGGTNPAQAAYGRLQNAGANDTSIPILQQMAGGSASPGDYSNIGTSNPAIGLLSGMAHGQANGETSQFYHDTLAGNYLNNNPFIDRIAQQGQDAALKAVNQRFAATGIGEGLSTPYAQAAGGSIADANNNLRYTAYGNELNRMGQIGAQSDSQFNATGDRNLAAAQGLGSLSNSTDALRLNAQQAKDGAFQSDRSSQLAAAQSLGSQNNLNNATSLAATGGNIQSILSGLGLGTNIADSQYKGIAGSAMLPYAGLEGYSDLINSLTGRYATTNGTSTGTEKYTPSALDSAGKVVKIGTSLASLFSDRRLKTDISRVGTTDDGLGVYTYRYTFGGPIHMGVMADEVAQIRPEALGPVVAGFATVNYGAL